MKNQERPSLSTYGSVKLSQFLVIPCSKHNFFVGGAVRQFSLFLSHSSFSKCQHLRETVEEWLKHNKLSRNYSKTHYMLIIKQKIPLEFDMNFDIYKHIVSKVDNVVLDNKLSWNSHITQVKNKYPKPMELSRLRHYLPINSLTYSSDLKSWFASLLYHGPLSQKRVCLIDRFVSDTFLTHRNNLTHSFHLIQWLLLFRKWRQYNNKQTITLTIYRISTL